MRMNIREESNTVQAVTARLQGQTLQQKALLVTLSISMVGNRKLDTKATKETEAHYATGAKTLRVSKTLYPPDSLEKVQQIQTVARGYHYGHTLAWADDGPRILPAAMKGEYDQFMGQQKGLFNAEVAAWLDRLSDWEQWGRDNLNGLFDASRYIPGKLAKKFGFSVEPLPIPSGGDFRLDLSKDELTRLGSFVDSKIESAAASAQGELVERLRDPLVHLVHRLRNLPCPCRACKGRAAKGAGFKDSITDNIREICGLVPKLNLGDDQKLEAFAREIDQGFSLLIPDHLRDSEDKRRETADRAAEILQRMAAYAPTVEGGGQ